MISVLIITKNEELDLPGCLESVSWSDDIHVFDSFSDDKTVAIAKARGAKVAQRVFDGFARQRNAALCQLSFKYPWLLILDADERIPSSLKDEMLEFVGRVPNSVASAKIVRRDHFQNRILRHAQMTRFYDRLVRVGRVKYEREVNEILVVQGKTEILKSSFDHYPFSKGLSHWINKHNRYASSEAVELLKKQGEAFHIEWKKLFSSDVNVRRVEQKKIFYRMPCRPLIKWFYLVIIRRAFLDGLPGLRYAGLMYVYEYIITQKAIEIRLSGLDGNPLQYPDFVTEPAVINAAQVLSALVEGVVQDPQIPHASNHLSAKVLTESRSTKVSRIG